MLEALAERQAGLPAEHRPGRKRGREAAASEEAATFAGGFLGAARERPFLGRC